MNSEHGSSSIKPLITLLFGALCISFAPIFVKLIGEVRLGPSAVGFWRNLFGGMILMAICFGRGRRPILSMRQLAFSAAAGFLFYLDLFVWHRSIYFCGAGMATILGNTQVFGTALLSFLIFKERLSVRYFISAASAMVGVVLLVGLISQEVEFSSRYIQGIIFGLATAIFYAGYLITHKWTGMKEGVTDFMIFMAWTSLFAAFFLGVTSIFESGPAIPPDGETWLLLFALGLVPQALGWLAITSSLVKIRVSQAGLVLLMQPTLAMVWGVLVFAEQFTSSQMVGALITLTAIYYGGLRQPNTDQ